MFSGFNLAIIGGLGAVILVGGFALYMFITNLQEKNTILESNNIKYEESIKNQKKLINQTQEDVKNIVTATKKILEVQSSNNTSLTELNNRFEKDLGYLAVKKPELIEKIVNNASDNALRCLEIISGSELTEREKNVTKLSEGNRECPNIANPNISNGVQ